ncbi:peptide-methionine (R)-S-oxide reductase MsrB [Paraburkholderia sp.]|uniref:peptide-methionine (R)-S-oxide reductase MsrB n=1 Tax=Paraburkholderia sp. TaxID=1926495 RepID=UPI003D7002B3
MQGRRLFLLAGGATAAALLTLVRGRLPGLPWTGTANAAEPAASTGAAGAMKAVEHFDVVHTDDEWRHLLTPVQYEILRREGTERPYTSPLNDEHHAGTFACAGCRLDAFSSRTKFDSHTGWPSFWAPLDHAIATREDRSFGVVRTEVHCSRCGGHLGHVFDDGPRPTGLRYCMNGYAMTFTPAAT